MPPTVPPATASGLTAMVGGVMRKLQSILVAAFQSWFPVWLARMVQVPIAMTVTVETLIVQTAGVSGEKLTARPEVAVALTSKGPLPSGLFPNPPKLIV